MKPRVLVLSTYYHPVLGGVEAHARQLVTWLHSHGYAVEVVTKRVDRAGLAVEEIDGVPVRRVPPAGQRKAAGKWLAIPGVLAALARLRARYDVIVCVDYRGVGVAAIAASRLFGRPVIAQGETAGVLAGAGSGSTSGLAPETALVRALKAPLRAVYRRADRIVCIGRDLEREALAAGVPRARVRYIPHGVDTNRFRPAEPGERDAIRRRHGWPLDRPVVLFVGRLSREKGVMDLLEAWRVTNRPSALLSLVGPDMTGHPWDCGGPGRAFVAAHGLGDRVRFEGPAADPAEWYRAADVFVQPSHFEALGNTAIEAMASGLPVVTSGVGGLADFCVDGENALLYEPRSAAAMARAIARLLDDPPLRGRLGEAGRCTAVERFEASTLLEAYAALIDEVAGPRR
ncbi:MAG TPA: glycosyltransferase family 4 protein [Vicinamibacterales bacterium]|jgi:D-inositol-3-phosphate glycosyltransferase|nr:glycosyltransferase family 4 protein [Vicinamibacterales bacterium]